LMCSAGGTIDSSTITGNSATFLGGGISVGNCGSGLGVLLLENTIVAAQTAGANCSGPISDGGYNLDDGTTCGFSSVNHSLTNTNPLLDPAGLQNNGGPTRTIALLSGSPAIDTIPAGVNGCGTTLTSDQRGVSRPQGPACDTGAFELDTIPPVITVPANITVPATSQAGATVSYTASANDAVDGPVPVTCTPASGSTFPIGTITVNCSASDKAGNIGHASFTVTVTAGDTTAPTTPTNLATPIRGKTTMVLTWGASTDPDDATLIYDIYVNDKKVGDTGGLRFQVQNLQCGMRYVFGVSARDQAGNVSGRVAKTQITLACG
jgi:hypothetical protein